MAKTNPQLKAEVRTITGKKVKSLRRIGIMPATVYGQEMTPMSIQVVDKEMEAIFNHVGESGLVELTVGSEKMPILFRNPQYKSKLTIKNDPEQVVVKTEEPRVEEEVVVEAPTEVTPAPAMNQKTEEEKAADDAKRSEEKKKEKEDK